MRKERVAVRLCGRDELRTDGARCSGLVFEDELLFEHRLQRAVERPSYGVAHAARRKRIDDGNGTRRVDILCTGVSGPCSACQCSCADKEAASIHASLLIDLCSGGSLITRFVLSRLIVGADPRRSTLCSNISPSPGRAWRLLPADRQSKSAYERASNRIAAAPTSPCPLPQSTVPRPAMHIRASPCQTDSRSPRARVPPYKRKSETLAPAYRARWCRTKACPARPGVALSVLLALCSDLPSVRDFEHAG